MKHTSFLPPPPTPSLCENPSLEHSDHSEPDSPSNTRAPEDIISVNSEPIFESSSPTLPGRETSAISVTSPQSDNTSHSENIATLPTSPPTELSTETDQAPVDADLTSGTISTGLPRQAIPPNTNSDSLQRLTSPNCSFTSTTNSSPIRPRSPPKRSSLRPRSAGERGTRTLRPTVPVSAIHENTDQLLTGLLLKISDGKWNKGKWHRRWFVLDKDYGVLRCYTSEKEYLNLKKRQRSSEAHDLNCANAALLFEAQYAERAPTCWFFQVSMQGRGERETKTTPLLKLCAECESDYIIWINAIGVAVNRKFQEDGYRSILASTLPLPTDAVSSEDSADEGLSEADLGGSTLEHHPSAECFSQPPLSASSPQLLSPRPVVKALWPELFLQRPLLTLAGINLFLLALRQSPPSAFVGLVLLLNFVLYTFWDSPTASFPQSAPLGSAISIIPTETLLQQRGGEMQSVARNPDPACRPASPSVKPMAGCSLRQQEPDAPTVPHRWDLTDVTAFEVRVGPDYRKNKLKAPSAPALCEVKAVDLYNTQQKLTEVYHKVELPPGEGHWVIVNLMLPSYAPGMWQKVWDGPGYSLIVYMLVPAETVEQMKVATSGPLELLRRFLGGDEMDLIYDRFKMIGKLINPEDVGLYSTERGLVTKYNAKPVLTRPQHQIYQGPNYTEIDVDVHIFGLIARKGLNGLLPRFHTMVLDIVFVIEAETNEELPECVLGGLRGTELRLHEAMHWQ
eukprot:NODE_400_length_2293_cov_88.446445_g371_i0.p1 GENE.NODE_400_length_2293_cov_88.446445_g371_i0~~NODE_400_length_2293_cov_88.446445_g371_i0.p1  ORF type:complete len:737 (-),score=153.65 NODE_400_length_2293_cov_88.446445_g371_i0:45-2255(-)